MTEIEDQILTVYHFWLREGPQGEQFARYLNGLFEMMQGKFPVATEEVAKNAVRQVS